MSRIGKMPILIPEQVQVNVVADVVEVKGPKGALSMTKRPEINVVVIDGSVVVSVAQDIKEAGAYWGLTRALIANMVYGVVNGYEKRLQIVGVGYRAKEIGNGITFSIGYSHPVEFIASDGIELKVEDNQTIVVKGIDKNLVGLTAAKIRKIRKPEPYKGKGIRYVDEVVRRKAGKSGKV